MGSLDVEYRTKIGRVFLCPGSLNKYPSVNFCRNWQTSALILRGSGNAPVRLKRLGNVQPRRDKGAFLFAPERGMMKKYQGQFFTKAEIEAAITSDDPELRAEGLKIQEWRNRSRFYSTPEWKNLRHLTFERDNYTCQDCGIIGKEHTLPRDPAGLVAHHKIERAKGGPDDIANLVTLCKTCHALLHSREMQESCAEMNRIGKAQFEAGRQCELDYIRQTGGIPQVDEAFVEFSKNWPGWANVPKYP